MRIYIAGPYEGSDRFAVSANIQQARQAMVDLLRLGHSPFCPHTMTAHLEYYAPDIPRETYLRTDLDWLAVCAALLLLPGWEESGGACEEKRVAEELGLQVFESLADVPPAQPL